MKVFFNGAWRRVSLFLWPQIPFAQLTVSSHPVVCYRSVSCSRSSHSYLKATLIHTSPCTYTVIDSKLPIDPSSTILGMSVRSDPYSDKAPVLWPSLIEKAVRLPHSPF
jgi:hypothetical protein